MTPGSPRDRPRAIGRLSLALLTFVTSLTLGPGDAFASPEEALLQRYPALGRDEHRRTIDIRSLLRKMDYAYRSCDLAAAAALIDFPLVVVTFAPDGRERDVRLGPEEWLEAVEALFNGPRREQARRTPPVVPLADSVAWIEEDVTAGARTGAMERGEHPIVVIRRRGKWLVKAIVDRLSRLGQLGSPDGSPCDR